MNVKKRLALSLVVLSLAAGPGTAHELMLKSRVAHPAAGEDFKVDLMSSHIFVVSQEIEEGVDVTEFKDGKAVVLPAKNDETALTVAADAQGDGKTQLFGAARLGSKYAVTNKGGKSGADITRKSLEEEGLKVKSINMYDKYAKTIVNARSGDDGYKQLLGQDVELVLMKNPADIKVGDWVDVKVLHRGSPESTAVYATYDGFSPEYENTYAFYTEGDPEGVAHIKITAPGTWMVRVESDEMGKEGDYDKRVIRTTLTFTVDEHK